MATAVGAADVKALRERTGAGMMDCKRALEEAQGDTEKAVEILRIKGQASAARRGSRQAGEGVVASYVHATQKIGVLVEARCETDFVARNEEFQEFARDVAVHVAALAPLYVSVDDVPAEAVQAERTILEQQVDPDKPAEIRQRIAEGRLRKWHEEVVLLGQTHVNEDKYGGRTIEEIRTELSAKTGENVEVNRFIRFEVGAD